MKGYPCFNKILSLTHMDQTNQPYGIKTYTSETEKISRSEFVDHFKKCPIPEDQLLSNLQ